MAEQKMVPELRFSEFNGEWIKQKTKNIAPLQRGFDLPISEVIEGKFPVVYSNGILRTHNQFKVKAPGVVTGRSGTIGVITYVEEDFWAHNTTLWVTDFFDNDPKFIYYFYTKFKLNNYNAGSTVPTLNRNDVHSVKKCIPSPSEQQKIASFLTAVDERLTALKKKKELLEKYKKGVMQKLFPSTGSGQIPEIRFKIENEAGELVDAPDWEEKKLGEVLKIGSGKDYKHLSNGTVPVYGSGGYMTSVNDYLHDGDTVCIGRKGTINRPLFFTGKIWTVDTLFYTYSFSNALERFMFYVFQTINWELYNEASGVPSLSKKTIESIKFDCPKLPEQKKISDFLKSIDEKITHCQTQIDKTAEWKKGLLQKMFV